MTQNKTIIAVVSARHRPEWRGAIRSTWLRQVPKDKADVFFFVGRGEPLADAEGVVELDCSDRYEHLPEKIRAIAKWALEHEYDYMLKNDDDVVLRPHDLLNCGYHLYDFSGRANRPESPYPVTCGFNYWLSKKAMELVVEEALPSDGSLDDEKWVAYTMHRNGINLHNDRRYFLHQFSFPVATDLSRRPLRAPKRPPVNIETCGPQPVTGSFSFCVHLAAETNAKVEEFRKVFERFGEKP